MSPRVRQLILRLWARVQHDYMAPALRQEWKELLALTDENPVALPEGSRRPMAGITWAEIVTL